MGLLAVGSVGQDVKNVQTGLNYHLPAAMPALIVDGKFGPNTRARVIQFQQKHGLKIDGLVGPETHRALFSFVECSHHMLVISFRAGQRRQFAARNAFGVGNGSSGPSPFQFPQLPRLNFPFPGRLPPVPTVINPPRLELDPKLLALIRAAKWEIEAGKQTSFTTNLGTGQTEREVALVGDARATVWSAPIGKHLEFAAGGGVVVEKRIKPAASTETSVYVFAQAEVKVLQVGPLELAKIAAEAQLSGRLGAQEPPNLSASIGGGPEVEVLGGKVTFGPGAYLQYETNGSTHTMSAQVKAVGTFHF